MKIMIIKKKIIKKWTYLLIKTFWLVILVLILLSSYSAISKWFSIYQDKKEKLFISFLDVGQGDASFIRTPSGKLIIIDGGPDNLVLYRLGEQMAFYERNIEAVIISHWHDDHVLGLIEILKRYQVKQLIFATGIENSSFTQPIFEEAVKNKTKIITISTTAKLNLDNQCEFLFLNPLSLKVKENSNNSLLAKLNCVNFSILFSGDNEKEVENVLLQSVFDLKANIFKASHHGSKTSNQSEFLKAINPKIMAISVGANNRFNHPSPEILEIAKELRIAVLRTDEQGSLVFSANIK